MSLADVKQQGSGKNSSEGKTTSMSNLLREICELKETLRLERSKNMDSDSKQSDCTPVETSSSGCKTLSSMQ